MFTLRQLDDEFLDECSHIVVGYDLALPLLDAEYRIRNGNLHVLLDLHLTAQTPVLTNLLAVEESGFGRQNLAAAFEDLTFALTAGTLAAASRREEYVLRSERIEQRAAAVHFENFLTAVDVDGNLARSRKFCLCKEQQCHQNECNCKKGKYCE